MKKLSLFLCALLCGMSAMLQAQTYVVTGSSEVLFSTMWAPTDVAENAMTLQSDLGLYTWTKENVTLPAGTIEYKFATLEDGWSGWNIPSSGNYSYTIEKGGVYNVSFVLRSDRSEGWMTATLVEETDVLVNIRLYGQFYDMTWAPTDPLTYNEDHSVASITLEDVAAAQILEFGFQFDGVWQANGAYITSTNNTTNLSDATTSENNMTLVTTYAGDYTFTYTVATKELVVTYPEGEGPEPQPGRPTSITLAGTFNGWDELATPLVFAEDGLTASVVVSLKKTGITADGTPDYAEFKFVVDGNWFGVARDGEVMTRGNSTNWEFLANTGLSGNCGIDADVDGDYTFIYQIGSTERGVCSVVYPSLTPTAVADVETDDTVAAKIIRNGQVLIVREGVTYNIVGQVVE